MSKWESEKEELERLINIEKVSYEEIGRRYGCSGSNIKKVAKQLGIELPQRRKINPNETFNKGTGKKYYCLNCGKELKYKSSNSFHKFCDNKCQAEYNYKQYIERWKNNLESGLSGKYQLSQHIRRYIFEKYNNKCCQCGWSEINPYSNTIPLEIDHVDGDYTNNKEENLRLLCPNCHSLTPTYKNLNKGKGRTDRLKYYYAEVAQRSTAPDL